MNTRAESKSQLPDQIVTQYLVITPATVDVMRMELYAWYCEEHEPANSANVERQRGPKMVGQCYECNRITAGGATRQGDET